MPKCAFSDQMVKFGVSIRSLKIHIENFGMIMEYGQSSLKFVHAMRILTKAIFNVVENLCIMISRYTKLTS